MVNSILISKPEQILLEAIEEVGYGELHYIEVQDAPRVIDKKLPDKMRKLLELIRDGNSCIESIKIHQKLPTQVAISGECKKIKFTKKIQL